MILDVEKYVFIGHSDDLGLFFQKAQKLGLIEFIDEKSSKLQLPSHLENMHEAIQILKKQPENDENIPEELNPVDLVDKILNVNFSIESLYEEKRLVHNELEKIAPFGNFSLTEIKAIESQCDKHMYFYAKKRKKQETSPLPDNLIYIETAYDHDYYISLTRDPVRYPGLFQVTIENSLSDLKEELLVLEKKLHLKRIELKDLAKYLEFLNYSFTKELEHVQLLSAKSKVKDQLGGAIFTAEAWIPKKYIEQVQELTKTLHVTFYPVAIEKKDRIPTCMENKGVGAMGEDLVHIYDVPSTSDKDPSTWVFFSFALFFAMIIADAGYGFIYLLASFFLAWKFPDAKGMLKRFIKLTRVLAISCIAWGILTTSFFGIELAPDNPITKFSMLGYLAKKKAAYHMKEKDDVYKYWIKEYPALRDVKSPEVFLEKGSKIKEGKLQYEIEKEFDDNIMMEISLLVGIIHVSLSLLRNLRRSWSGVGWVLFIVGGYMYFPKMLDATSMLNFLEIVSKPVAYQIGMQILGTGFVVATATSLIQNRLGGLSEAFKMIEIFADVLSYLRLYALGLASMILAMTFNTIGQEAGLFFGILIILSGHVTNIVLGTMAGVIHGLRLNFLEWYHHSFEGGGKKFNPLKLLIVRSE